MTNLLFQAWILITGAASIWLLADPAGKARRAGCWIGLAGQPLWFISTWHNSQWGMFLLTTAFTASYIRGLLQHRRFSTFRDKK